MRKLSVIIPAFNEEDNISPLMEKFHKIINENKLNCEVLLVDDGSTDHTYQLATECAKKYNFLKVLHHNKKMGITNALLSGFKKADGELYMFLGADLEVLPSEIPKYLAEIDNGADVVCGWMQDLHKKPLGKRIVSNIYNAFSRKLFGVKVHHMNSPKVFRKEVVEDIPLRKDWHRYIVVLAAESGYRISEVKIQFYPRAYGKIKYRGGGRILIGILDLLAVKFQMSFMRKPMLFFGSIGGGLLLTALVVGIVALYLRFVIEKGYRPLLYLVIFLGISGLLLFVLGFLAEAIAGIQDEIKKLSRK